jgi:O-antigen/teichoic acid export membrane protein
MVVIILLGALLIPSTVTMILGETYAKTGEVARILLIGTAFMGILLLLDTYFVNQLHRPGMVSILAWVNGVMGVGLAVLLVPNLGVTGAAWTQAMIYTVGTLIYLGLYLRISKTKLKQLIFIRDGDVTMIREQAVAMLKWREGRR